MTQRRRPRQGIVRKLKPVVPPAAPWGQMQHRARTGVPADHFQEQGPDPRKKIKRGIKKLLAEKARRERKGG